MPDYKRFGIENLTEDMFNLLKKRTYDIGAVTDKTVRVKFNGEAAPFRQFEQYIDMYIGPKKETKRLFESSPRWEYAVSMSPLDEFTQVSFVNGIHTGKGGKHVEYILNQIVKKLIVYIEKKKKVKVKPATIKEQLMLFVNCVIENPAFDSQTKDYMNTPVSKFGSKCDVSSKFIEKLAKMGIMEMAIASNELKHQKKAKNTDGKKTRSVRGIPKLMDANFAGGKKSAQCTLLLCEGDSAKAGIVSGLSKEDRNLYGIFPLKGKLMNVLDIPQSKINMNEEIANIKRQIDELDDTNKYVLPLLEKMVIRLRELLEIDVPFLEDERYARLEELEDILYKANFSTAEKFRKIYEAYQIENEYGRTIEAYSSSIEVDGVNLAAQFFRLGRLNLYYMTPDGDETGYWNKNINKWVHLGGKYADEIDAALKIAYKQAPPDFINLPVQGVEK